MPEWLSVKRLKKKKNKKHSPENDQDWIENEWKNPPMSKEKF